MNTVDAVGAAVRPRFGLYGVAVQLGLALVLGIFVAGSGVGQIGPSDHVERGIVLGLLFAVPGVIAAMGVRSGHSALLIAALLMDMSGVLLSYATLVFVVPAAFFVAHVAATSHGPARPAAVVGDALVGAALITLVVGAGAVLLTTTESRCWTAYPTSTGTVYRFSPYVGNGVEISVPVGAIGSGCDTGVLTPHGEATAAVLGLGAIALAALASRRRPEPAAA